MKFRLTKDQWFHGGKRVSKGTILTRATPEEFHTAFNKRNVPPWLVLRYESDTYICLWWDGKARLFDRKFTEEAK